jgi:toxin ParE1/3/4
MPPYRIRYARRAITDLNQIWEYIATHSGPDRADYVLDEIRERVDELAVYPARGHRHQEIASPSLLVINVFAYLVVYRVEEQVVTIVRVIDGRRDLKKLFGGRS